MDEEKRAAETIPAPAMPVEATELEQSHLENIILKMHLLKMQVDDLDRQKLEIDRQKLEKVAAMRALQEQLKPYAAKFGPGMGVAFSPETMSISGLVKAPTAPPSAK